MCDSCVDNAGCDEVKCEKNSIVVCNTVHQLVAITEKKQRCGQDSTLETTKICFTYPNATWVCREPRDDGDCDRYKVLLTILPFINQIYCRESLSIISHEVATPTVECLEKELG